MQIIPIHISASIPSRTRVTWVKHHTSISVLAVPTELEYIVRSDIINICQHQKFNISTTIYTWLTHEALWILKSLRFSLCVKKRFSLCVKNFTMHVCIKYVLAYIHRAIIIWYIIWHSLSMTACSIMDTACGLVVFTIFQLKMRQCIFQCMSITASACMHRAVTHLFQNTSKVT